MRRSLIPLYFTAIASTTWSACASHHPSPENGSAWVAALHAVVRVVRGDTTWVTRGRGYELVGRTPADLIVVQPALERTGSFLAGIYPHDSVAELTISVRRAPVPGKPWVSPPPLPEDSRGPRVEAVVIDPKTIEEQRKRSGAPPFAVDPRLSGSETITPVVRAWLSARATRLTGKAARSDQLVGASDDPRVPAWAVEMVGSAGNAELIDDFTKSLAAHPDAMIPLGNFLTVERPAPMAMGGGRRDGEPGGDAPPSGRGRPGGGGMGGGMGGMGGGMGGMGGGMGGGRGGMGRGRGGMGGGMPGGGPPGGSSRRGVPLQGPLLFRAQSTVLPKYLARFGSDVIGDLIDAQMMEKPVDDVFAGHQMGALAQVDADWRAWVIQRADGLNRH